MKRPEARRIREIKCFNPEARTASSAEPVFDIFSGELIAAFGGVMAFILGADCSRVNQEHLIRYA